MKPKEFASLVSLLEDPDYEVYKAISEKLVQEGLNLVPLLENAWENSNNELLQKRIEDILHSIQFQSTTEHLTSWVNSGANDLLQGAVCIAKFQYPDIEYEIIDNQITKIKQKVWVELNESLTALEKVKVLNHTLFDIFGYSGNTTNFFSPQNHYINQLIETKKGGPVLISIFYSLIAQRLGLPIFGVSLPRNFLLAYKDRFQPISHDAAVKTPVLFYINPFSNGTVLGRREIEQFLNQNNIEPKDEYFVPCSNKTTISQLVASLMISYQKTGDMSKVDDLKVFLDILSEEI
jgi:regulator of sirC expression with transglutaminase-like and TPR domain